MSKSKHEIIEVDTSLVLEQLKLEDADRLFALTDNDRAYLSEFLPWPQHTKTVDDSKGFIELMLQRRSDDKEYGYGIKYNDVVIGHTSLMHLGDGKRPEIGYWIASEYGGKGIMTKVVIALTDFAINRLGVQNIIIRADPKNIGSNRVAEKAGYAIVGQEDEDGKILNVWGI